MSKKPIPVPPTMTIIAEASSLYWEGKVRVNRALWRKLTFNQQADIGLKINLLFQRLEDDLEAIAFEYQYPENVEIDTATTEEEDA